MSALFFKYYTDVTRYNLAFSVLMFCFASLVQCIIVFGTIGTVVSFWAYRYFQNVEYNFYRNGGLTKVTLRLKTVVINMAVAAIMLMILWAIK